MTTVLLAAEDRAGAAWCVGVALALEEAKVRVARWVGIGLGGLPVLSLSGGNEVKESLVWLGTNQAASVLKRRAFRPHAWGSWDNFSVEARAELVEQFPHWELGPHHTARNETSFAWVGQEDGQCIVIDTARLEDTNRTEIAMTCCLERRLAGGKGACLPALHGEWEDTPLHQGEAILAYACWRAPRYAAPNTLRMTKPQTGAQNVNQLLQQARAQAGDDLQGCDLPGNVLEGLVNLGFLVTYCRLTRRAPDAIPFADGYGLWNAIAALAHVPYVPRESGSRPHRVAHRPRRRADSDAQSLLGDVDRPQRTATHLPRRRESASNFLSSLESAVEDTFDLGAISPLPEEGEAQRGEREASQQEPSVEPSGPLELDESIHSQSGSE